MSITQGKEFTYCIDAHEMGNFTRFFNHLCEPNMISIRMLNRHHDFRFPHLAFFTTRDILPGEELGFDYGDGFWSVKNENGIYCCCKNKSCKYGK